jgi:diguanylate cyclase (GGDEF)-like protein/PAS domain S-box-containing protein
MRSQAEANLAALIESTKDLIWSVDLEFRLIAFNRALRENIEDNFGGVVEVGSCPRVYLPADRAVHWPQMYERALRDGPYRTEYVLVDGRTLELSFNPISEDGKLTGISVFGKDVTARNAAEKRYRDIFYGALEGVFQSSEDGRILDANPALLRMFGYESLDEMRSSIRSTSLDVWANPEDRAELMRQLETQDSVRGYECQFLRKDKSTFWVSLGARKVFHANGELLYLEGFIEDISERKRAELLSRENEMRMLAFLDNRASMAWMKDVDGRYVFMSKSMETHFNLLPGECLGKTDHDLFPVELADRFRDNDLQVLAAGSLIEFVEKDLSPSGKVGWWFSTKFIFTDEHGKRHVGGFAVDITERIEAEERLATATAALRKSEEQYRTAFETTPDAISIFHMDDGKYVNVNRAFLEMTGYEHQEVIGHSSAELKFWVYAHDRARIFHALREHGKCRDLEMQLRKKNGDLRWARVSATTMDLGGIPCALGVVRDITDVKEAQDEIHQLASFDSLTGMPNRRMLLERLETILAVHSFQHRKRALLIIGLDNFKTLNETLGHTIGDLFLEKSARRLADIVREATIVARLGGDEFAVLLEDLSAAPEEAAEQARAIGEKILLALSQTCKLGGHECRCTASMGINIFGEHEGDSRELFQQADMAMGQAKGAGRNTMRFFSPSLQAAVNARALLEEELRCAIGTDQLLLYYQPQIEANRLIGAEVLLRWNHPRRGLLSPNQFIKLAEETGLILPLGKWVLETACRQLATWKKQKVVNGISISVNISARQFRQPDFVAQVLAAIGNSGVNPARVELELTESMLAENLEEITATMNELRSHGLRFSLDDFGTGYSSLSYLKRLPLDQLKIDLSFVRDILVDTSSSAIAQTIISLSRAMGLSVIAEGVETEEQRVRLDQLGCHAFQGYLFSKPLSPQDYEKLQTNHENAFGLN